MTVTKDKAFCVTSVMRGDIKGSFDKKYHNAIDKIPDDDMQGFAHDIGDCLMSGGGYYMYIEEFGKELFIEYYIEEVKDNDSNPRNYPKDCPHEEEYIVWWNNGKGTGCSNCPDFDICKTDNGWCDYWDKLEEDAE